MKRRLCLVLALCGSAFPISALAHDPGLSSVHLTVSEDTINAVAIFNARDLVSLANDGATYTAIAPELLRVGIGGKPLLVSVSKIEKDQNDNITFRLTFARSGSGPLEISSGILDRLPFGHREFLSVNSAAGAKIAERLLSMRENQFTVRLPDRSAPAVATSFVDFFLLGVRHILTGYDHLLFLFGLLIVSRNVRSAALLITCFTIAHSLTLALSTFGIVSLQSRFIEPAIAASIVYVGIENLTRENCLQWRWVLTFAFGLIHGLGFASVLREMGVAKTGAVVPLFAFNLGVEAGQLSIAAIVLPIVWQLRQRPTFLRFGVPACSIIVAFAGAYWLIERTILS
jgi:hydrogenase/urease accessory protein HupE